MTRTANGLAKLLEELGELAQVATKRLAYFHTDVHPDGAGNLGYVDMSAEIDALRKLMVITKAMSFTLKDAFPAGMAYSMESAQPIVEAGEAQPTNFEDAARGNVKAIRHIAYSEGYADGKRMHPEPAEPRCPHCGTREVSMERTCHNSKCLHYAAAQTTYEGWRLS